MRTILEANNKDILREIKSLRDCLKHSEFPQALNGYYQWVLSFLIEKEKTVIDNLYYLSLNVDAILSEIMERTQSVTLNIRILSAKYISPLSRYSSADNLSIMFLQWLHDQHPQSKDIPFAVSDGNFSIFPSTDIPLIYYLPVSSQKSLLHLSLFFHEYGHYLFEFHRKEMNDYIMAMQDDMEELLLQPYQQNDIKFHRERIKAKNIIETWYDWIEEIFCDLVGLTIGGPAFLQTFSMYLRMSGREAFYLADKELENSAHPVSWIRIRFLVDRAKKMGFEKDANSVEDEWRKMAALMNTMPVYHGYYVPAYDNIINRTLDSMIEEANPINFNDYTTESTDFSLANGNFIQLVVTAWRRQPGDDTFYENWEKEILNHYTKITSLSSSVNVDEIKREKEFVHSSNLKYSETNN